MENRKHKIHIKTGEYEFVEADVEGTPNEVADYYIELKDALTGGEGLNQLEWAKVRNHYANTGEIEPEDHERCNKLQRYILGQFKKSFIK